MQNERLYLKAASNGAPLGLRIRKSASAANRRLTYNPAVDRASSSSDGNGPTEMAVLLETGPVAEPSLQLPWSSADAFVEYYHCHACGTVWPWDRQIETRQRK
jgi:hypothetical protein